MVGHVGRYTSKQCDHHEETKLHRESITYRISAFLSAAFMAWRVRVERCCGDANLLPAFVSPCCISPVSSSQSPL